MLLGALISEWVGYFKSFSLISTLVFKTQKIDMNEKASFPLNFVMSTYSKLVDLVN